MTTPSALSPSMERLLQTILIWGGSCSANDDKYAPIIPFCDDDAPTDTFNQAIELGYVGVTHDSDSDNSTCCITDKGRVHLRATKPRALPITSDDVKRWRDMPVLDVLAEIARITEKPRLCCECGINPPAGTSDTCLACWIDPHRDEAQEPPRAGLTEAMLDEICAVTRKWFASFASKSRVANCCGKRPIKCAAFCICSRPPHGPRHRGEVGMDNMIKIIAAALRTHSKKPMSFEDVAITVEERLIAGGFGDVAAARNAALEEAAKQIDWVESLGAPMGDDGSFFVKAAHYCGVQVRALKSKSPPTSTAGGGESQ